MKDVPEIISQMASDEHLNAGLSLFKKGSVLDIRPDSRGATIRLASRPGKFETVQLTVKFQSLLSRCSCGIGMSGTLCSHGVAAAMAYRKNFPEKFDYCFADPNGIEGGETVWSGTEAPKQDNTKSALKKKKISDIVRNFEKYKGRLIIRALNTPEGESRWHKINLKAEIEYEDKSFASTNIRRILDLDNAAGGMTLEDFPPQDVMLMRYLNTNADRKGHTYQMNAHVLSGFFHCLTGFTRFFAGDEQLKISVHPVILKLKVSQKDKGYELKPSLKIEGQGLLNLEKCSILAGTSGYWIGIDTEYHWLPGVADVQWISGFLKGEEVFLSEKDFIMLRQACEDRVLPIDLELAENSSNLIKEECTPIMNLDWNNSVIQARIFFEYGNYISVKSSQETVWNGSRFIFRDAQKEEDAYTWLTENNFEQVDGSENTFYLSDFDSISRFLLRILPELSHTWQIYYSDNFSNCARHIKPIQMKVKTVEENENWVELSLDFQYNEESIKEWQHIINAVRTGRELIKLDDGRMMKIDEEMQRTLQNLPALDTLNKGQYRFSRYMSMMMNQLLGGYIEESSDAWRVIDQTLLNADKKPKNLKKELKKTLRPYQLDGLAWLQAMKKTGFNAVLADEMGLGKTIQALALLSSDKKQASGRPSLVICPKSLIDNWFNECSKFTPELSAKVISGTGRTLDEDEILNTDLVITSYALIRRDVEFYAKIDFENVILDEAQNIKNHQSQTAQACKVLNARNKLVLSGTPVENSIKEIWSLFDFLLPGLLGSASDFKGRYEIEVQPEEGGEEQKATPSSELATRIKPFILRRLKKDLLKQLPPKQEQILYCELSDEQKSIYSAIAREAGTIDVGDYNKKRFAVLALLLRLRQVCCHPTLIPAVKESAKDVESSKFELLKELIYEIKNGSNRALVFSQFTSMLKIIARWLADEGIKFEYLDGSTQNRQEKVDRFNEDDTIPIFLLSLKAGGTGLNLTGADTVIHYDMWWNPQVEDQATDRTHRIGQTKAVNVIKLVVKDSIEEKVLSLQNQKRKLFENLMDGIPQKLGELSKEDLTFLLGD
ncbi:MAG: SNF2 family helicase [Lentisphaeraceae bacterium]|nr:SNF2 family helicase [Lentisphaeraceae bacterium]